MSKITKIIKVIIFIMLITMMLTNSVYARPVYEDDGTGSSSSQIFDPNIFKPTSETEATNVSKIEVIGNRIIGVIQVIGTIVSVFSLIVIGIKYMLGSVEEKAEYKKTLKPYLIGAILLFGITNILGLVQGIVTNL